MTWRKWWPLITLTVVVAFAFTMYSFSPNEKIVEGQAKLQLPSTNETKMPGGDASKTDMVMLGGVLRPATDIVISKPAVQTNSTPKVDEVKAYPYGKTPLLDPNTNPQVASAFAALKEKKTLKDCLHSFTLPHLIQICTQKTPRLISTSWNLAVFGSPPNRGQVSLCLRP